MEFPQIQKLADKYGSKDFFVVTVNTLPSSDATGKMMMARRSSRFIDLTTPDDNWAFDNYQIRASPTTVLLDGTGKVIMQHSGYSLERMRELDQAISHLTEDSRRIR